jgi:hypothetical protein
LTLVFFSFGSFFFQNFLPILQSLSYGNPGETKLEVLLTDSSCCTDFSTYISISFSSYFFKVALKNSIKMYVEKHAFVHFEVVYNQTKHEMVSHRNHCLFRPREPIRNKPRARKKQIENYT